MIDHDPNTEQGILNLIGVLFVGATMITGCVSYSVLKRVYAWWCEQGGRIEDRMWWGRLL